MKIKKELHEMIVSIIQGDSKTATEKFQNAVKLKTRAVLGEENLEEMHDYSCHKCGGRRLGYDREEMEMAYRADPNADNEAEAMTDDEATDDLNQDEVEDLECSNCGGELDDDFKFCPDCGEPCNGNDGECHCDDSDDSDESEDIRINRM